MLQGSSPSIDRKKTNPLPAADVRSGLSRGLVYAVKKRTVSCCATIVASARSKGWWRESRWPWPRTSWTLRASSFNVSWLAWLRRCCLVIPDLLSRGWYAPKKQVVKEKPQRIRPTETEKQDQREGNKHASVSVQFHKYPPRCRSIYTAVDYSHSHTSRSGFDEARARRHCDVPLVS